MYLRPDDVIREHQADLMDEACRHRRSARLSRARRLRRRAELAASRSEGADSRPL